MSILTSAFKAQKAKFVSPTTKRFTADGQCNPHPTHVIISRPVAQSPARFCLEVETNNRAVHRLPVNHRSDKFKSSSQVSPVQRTRSLSSACALLAQHSSLPSPPTLPIGAPSRQTLRVLGVRSSKVHCPKGTSPRPLCIATRYPHALGSPCILARRCYIIVNTCDAGTNLGDKVIAQPKPSIPDLRFDSKGHRQVLLRAPPWYPAVLQGRNPQEQRQPRPGFLTPASPSLAAPPLPQVLQTAAGSFAACNSL